MVEKKLEFLSLCYVKGNKTGIEQVKETDAGPETNSQTGDADQEGSAEGNKSSDTNDPTPIGAGLGD